jgi:hypothetical protein
MSPTERARGVGKTGKDRVPPDQLPLAKKTFRKPVEPEARLADIDFTKPEPHNRIADIDFTKNTWSVKMAARWAGVPERTLYRMLRAGIVPCIALGESQTQEWPSAHDGKRRRTCYRFLIPSVAFMKAWENLGTDKTAA